MNWTNEQKKVIDTRNCNLLVSAAAGSGKTAVLVERIIQMVFDSENPIDIDRLLVVTFTKAAASQMKTKITAAIEDRINENPDNERYIRQLNLVSDANIMTIDSFCYSVLKEYFHVISIDPKIRIADEMELELVKYDVLDEVLEECYRDNKDFVDFANCYSDKNDSDIEELIIRLYELSQSYPFPEQWLISARKELHIEGEEDISKLPYVNAYIKEIHEFLEEVKNDIERLIKMTDSDNGPAHYRAALESDMELLADYIDAKTYGQFHVLSQRKFQTLKRAKNSDVFDPDVAEYIKNTRNKYKDRIGRMMKSFSMPVDIFISQCGSQEGMLKAFIDAAHKFSKCFLEKKLSLGLAGFSDVEHFALDILCSGVDENGMPIQSDIGRELSEKFNEILVDEYQDSNYLQEHILQCVSKIPSGENNFFMVGDVKQSIYGFRMARPDLFTEKYEYYEDITDKDIQSDEKNGEKKILLNRNFRSRKKILETINYFFYQIMDKKLGGIDYTEKEALIAGKEYPEYENDMVEIIIGESKRSEGVDGNEDHLTEEHLSDEYIDVSALELEAGITADRIQRLMGSDGGERYRVTDELTGKMRPVEYRDIVILFRSPKNYQPVFSEVLMKQGIPVKLQNENGYFDMVEISGLMTLLNMVDNPYNDVECAALLRGFFGGLDSNDMAITAIAKRYAAKCRIGNIDTTYMYTFIDSVIKDRALFEQVFQDALESETGNENTKINYRQIVHGTDELLKKYQQTVNIVNTYQQKRKVMSITELVRSIYYETGYYYYIKSMPEGKERSRNLDLFLEETALFENGGYRSLFDYLRFVKRISERRISLGGDALSESNENVVRIMSIHKSKGLEFPVVFVSGLGKQFNRQDTRSKIILHSDYHIAARYIDPVRRCGNDSFSRQVFASLMNVENIAEELRIFYVALTRAKEKLIMTGVTADIVDMVERLQQTALCSNRKLPYAALRDFQSYMDFMIAALMRNREFYKKVRELPDRYDKDGNIRPVKYDVAGFIERDMYADAHIDIKIYDYDSIIKTQIETGSIKGLQREEKLQQFALSEAVKTDELRSILSWKYEDDDLVKQKSKMSVTEIKRIYQNSDNDDLDNMWYERQYREKLPAFIRSEKSLDSALKGTFFHKAMELIDFSKLNGYEEIKKELSRLFEDDFLPKDVEEFITVDKIFAFSNSGLGKRMIDAAADGRLYKERKFVIGFPVKDRAPQVIVQGIIDAYFVENDNIILMDYKTDRIKAGEEQKLVERYSSQLKYYKETLERITGKKVVETYIYSFALDKEINM